MKHCNLCNKDLPLSAFYESDNRPRCKECVKAKTKARSSAAVASDLCGQCGKPKDPADTGFHCKKCKQYHLGRYYENRDEILLDQQARRVNDRRLAFEAYGAVCKCCGEDDTEKLTLDHIHNDGAAHRKTTGITHLASWARINGFPPILQTYCMNCNWSKRIKGVCAHQIQQSEVATPIAEVVAPRKCIKCSKAFPGSDFYGEGTRKSTVCKTCTKAKAAARRADLLATGCCIFCTKPGELTGGLCGACIQAKKTKSPEQVEQTRKADRERTLRIKLEAFEHYGGAKCVKCGEENPDFLSLDHINGDGAAHRRSIRPTNHRSIPLAKWARQHNFPKGIFRVLCMACNWASARKPVVAA